MTLRPARKPTTVRQQDLRELRRAMVYIGVMLGSLIAYALVV